MKRILSFCLLAAALAGCAGAGAPARTAKYPNAATPEMKARFEAADGLYRSQRLAEADAAFERIIAEFPYAEITDESRFRRGEIAFMRQDYNAAIAFYRQAFSEIVSPRVAPKARFKAALSLFNLGRPKEALEEVARIDRRDASAVLRLRADSLAVRSAKATGAAPDDAIIWHLRLLDDYAESQGVVPTGIPAGELVSESGALLEVRRWIGDNSVTAEKVEALPMKELRGRRSGGFAAYKLALAYHTSGDTKAATRHLRSYLTAYPKHEYYGAARLLLGELGGAVGEGAGIAVGVVLPLSGKYAVYGESALHGIECAIGVFEPCAGPAGMRIVVRDSESIPGGDAAAIDELAQENVVAIVGPLLSATAPEGARRAQELGIPAIVLSQRAGLAEVGDFVFQNSVSDDSEMTTLADYVVNKMGLRRFFIISSPSKKGSEYRDLFTDAVKNLGGSIAGVQAFTPTRVEGGGPSDELRGRYLAEQQMQMREGSAADEREAMIDFSVARGGYDAVFIPDSIGVAAYIAERMALSAHGRSQLIGISRWDDQRLVDRAGSAVDGAVFVDGFYKGAPDEHVASFVSRFRDAYGVEPTLLEALGYDSMRILISAVQEKGARGRDAIREAVARTANFPGVTGKIHFDDEGRAKKELWVLRVRDGRIEPAK